MSQTLARNLPRLPPNAVPLILRLAPDSHALQESNESQGNEGQEGRRSLGALRPAPGHRVPAGDKQAQTGTEEEGTRKHTTHGEVQRTKSCI